MAIFVRTAQDPATLSTQLVNTIHSVDPDQPVYRVVPMETVVSAAIGQRRFSATPAMLQAPLAETYCHFYSIRVIVAFDASESA